MESATKTHILSISTFLFVGALAFGALGYMLGALDPAEPEPVPCTHETPAEVAELRKQLFLQSARIEELEALVRELGGADKL